MVSAVHGTVHGFPITLHTASETWNNMEPLENSELILSVPEYANMWFLSNLVEFQRKNLTPTHQRQISVIENNK